MKRNGWTPQDEERFHRDREHRQTLQTRKRRERRCTLNSGTCGCPRCRDERRRMSGLLYGKGTLTY